jgi:hypothetical protein
MAEKISLAQSVSGSAAAFEWHRSSKPIDGLKRNRAGEKIVVLTCELTRSNRAGWITQGFQPSQP